jgi:hypothetical protein
MLRNGSQDSSVDIATGYWLHGLGSNLTNERLFPTAFGPILGSTQPPIQWVPGALSPGVKRQGRKADHSPPSIAEVKKGGAIPPLSRMSSWHSA